MAQNEGHGFRVELEREDDYSFRVEFDQEGSPPFWMDEPPPLGKGEGPNAARVLGAAIGNCLSASLLFCLKKARVEAGGVRTAVEGTIVRNEDGRLRIKEVSVEIHPEIPEEHVDRIQRCLGVFEDYCLVTQSVREGIDVRVSVKPAAMEEAAAIPTG